MTFRTHTRAELWAALADPKVLHRANELTRTDRHRTMNSLEWSTFFLDGIEQAVNEIHGPGTTRHVPNLQAAQACIEQALRSAKAGDVEDLDNAVNAAILYLKPDTKES